MPIDDPNDLGSHDDLLELFDQREAEDSIVFTSGFTSGVFDSSDDCIGHVQLLDLDNQPQEDVRAAAEATDSVTAVFESSPGSYHLWNLTVQPFEDAILDGLSWQIADAEHVKQSYRRGCYVIRGVAKVREDGTEYKPAPELKAIYCDTDTDEPVSAAHLEWVQKQAARHGVHDPTADLPADATVGDATSLRMQQYMSIDDRMKEELR